MILLISSIKNNRTMNTTNSLIAEFQEIDKTMVAQVGGKAANLGELSRIDGILVPDGFCISTRAFKIVLTQSPLTNELLNQLSKLKLEDREKITELSARIRSHIENIAIPEEIAEEIIRRLARLGEKDAYAIRSSATAEDLPTASFAGQQDSYLNIVGKKEILAHISKCWASLFTDRAVTYRIQNDYDHRKAWLAVVVQKMIFSQVAGILFTADPLSGNRNISSIDASFGLGEALVSGRVNADMYRVRHGSIIEKKISTKKLAVYAVKNGGTEEEEIDQELRHRQALTDAQILRLEQTGRKIEKHFGHPQDIEWCFVDDSFFIVQSRPITTLYPIPVANDLENHVYVSVGHQQMMTDPIRPLGLSIWQLTAARTMYTAGGRIFVDVIDAMASPNARENLLNVLGQSDPLIKDALITIIERGNFIKLLPEDKNGPGPIRSAKGLSTADIQALVGNDRSIVTELVGNSQAAIESLKKSIQTKSGVELFDLILEDIQQLKSKQFNPKNLNAIMAGINASVWVNEKMLEWLGEKNVADTLSQSVPNNITSEMGLALLDVADLVRPYPEIVAYLQQVPDNEFPDGLLQFNGGKEIWTAVLEFLEKFGMRCAGEIDITKTRWSERPAILVPMILNNIRNLEVGAGNRKFEQGRQQALEKERHLLDRLKHLPDGEQKARETKQMIDLIRNFSGYREYPKYGIVNRYFIYKKALLEEAGRLVQSGVIAEKEDIYFLSFEELRELVRTKKLEEQALGQRKEEFKLFEKLFPPRVMTSEGETITGRYKRENSPAGAIVGIPVSSGLIEGRARVILQIENANLGDEDILVTTFTDPSWTPLFLAIKGLVTEVGGLMTHGAVIAREYGLPAVVGVENATSLIKDGQRIRVNGTDGYVEII
jgi:rifampicin phosphotransferase